MTLPISDCEIDIAAFVSMTQIFHLERDKSKQAKWIQSELPIRNCAHMKNELEKMLAVQQKNANSNACALLIDDLAHHFCSVERTSKIVEQVWDSMESGFPNPCTKDRIFRETP